MRGNDGDLECSACRCLQLLLTSRSVEREAFA